MRSFPEATRVATAFVASVLYALFMLASNAEPSSASSIGHLYVALEQLGFGGSKPPPVIMRYSVSGWTLSSKPDLEYPGFGAPLAFDSAGNLFAGQGSLSQFKTNLIYEFAPGQTKPERTFSIPNYGWASYVTSMAVDPVGYMTIGYTRYATSSSFPTTWIATRRLSDKKVLNQTEIVSSTVRYPVNGMSFRGGVLYVSYGNSVHAYGSIDQPKLRDLGFLRNKVMRTPGGLDASSNGTLYVVDLPPKRKASVSSYKSDARGHVQPERTLTPVLGEEPLWCCAYGGPFVLRYQIDVYKSRLYLPFLRTSPTGEQVTGVYEFNSSQSGVSTPIASIVIAKSPPGQYPWVAAAALIGP